MPCFVCSSPSAPGATASHRAPGAGGHRSGALVPASNRGGGVTTGARELGCSVGPKAEIFPPPPKKFPFPRWVFKLCKYLEKRYLLLLLAWCHCFREGGEGGAGPFQQRPQEPHTPFYKKYTNILLTFLHRFFFPPLPLQVKTTPLSYFFFSYVQRAPRAGHPTIYRLCTEAGLALQLLLQLQHVQGGHFGHLKEEPGRKSRALELGRAPPV